MRVVDATEDSLIQTLIASAVNMLDGAEGLLSRCLITQQWQWTLYSWPERLVLPLAPIITVDSITYDIDDVTTTVAAEDIKQDGYQGTLLHVDEKPTVTIDTLTIVFTAGYGNAADVPDLLKQGIKYLVSHWFDNRIPVSATKHHPLPMAVDAIMEQYSRKRAF